MSYAVDGVGRAATFDPGTNVLLAGTSSATDETLFDVATPRDDERVVVVTMNHGFEWVIDRLAERGTDREQIGVIDCTSHDGDPGDASVRQLRSPGDLTGISLEFAKLLDGWEGGGPIRVGFASVSTALMYTELQTMFRFLHVFTSRIRSGGMFGAFAMDPEMHDPKAHNTIRTVFDCQLRVDESEVELRGSGFEA